MAPVLIYGCCQIINSDYQRLVRVLLVSSNVSVSDEWTKNLLSKPQLLTGLCFLL